MSRPGFSVCICPDSGLLQDHIAAVLDAAPPENGAVWQRQAVWGDDVLPDSFWEQLSLPDLFGSRTALVLRHAELVPAETWRQLSARLARPVEAVWLFLCLEVDFERGEAKIPAHIAKTGCMRFAQEQGWQWRHGGLDARSIRDFVRPHIRRLGLRFAAGVETRLVAALPYDASAAVGVLEQLSLLAGDGEVTEAMTELARRDTDMDIFTLIRGFQGSGGAPVWRQLLRSRLSGESMVFSLLGLLQREARQLWQLLSGGDVRMPPSVLGQKKELARSLGHAGLGRLWQSLLDAEYGVKSGERSPEQALDMLSAELFSLFGRLRIRN